MRSHTRATRMATGEHSPRVLQQLAPIEHEGRRGAFNEIHACSCAVADWLSLRSASLSILPFASTGIAATNSMTFGTL